MEHVLRLKEKSQQNMGVKGQQFSILNETQRVLSHPYTSALRNFAVEGCGWDKRTNITVSSGSMIGEVFLVVELKDGNGDNYCKNIAAALLQNIRVKYAGRSIHNDSYQDLMWLTFMKLNNEEMRTELIRLTGNASAAGDNPGKVIVWLPTFHSALKRNWAQSTGWRNEGSQKLEYELDWSSALSCSAGTANNDFVTVDCFFEEIYLPIVMEQNVKPANRTRVIHDFVEKKVASVAGQELEIDISECMAAQHTKVIWIKDQDTASGTSTTKDVFQVGRGSAFSLTLNSKELVDYDDQVILDVSQALQRFRYPKDRKQPFAFSFGANPSRNEVSNHLPSANSHLVLKYVPEYTGFVTVICEGLKRITRGSTGRLVKSD